MDKDFSKLNILAVEDVPLNLQIIEAYINMIGAKPFTARNGLECLEIFKKSEEGFFDAIFVDLKMPHLDGYATAKKIRELNRSDSNIFIALMSGNSYEEETANMVASQINAYLEKPLDVDNIKEMLEKEFF